MSAEPVVAGLPAAPRTLFLLHEQRFLYFQEPSYIELYLPMKESGLLGETAVHAYQRDIRFARTLGGEGEPAGLFYELLDHRIAEFRPDLVVYALTWPQESIPPQMLRSLRAAHGFRLASVIWDHDEANPLLQNYDRHIIAASDCTIVADSAARSRAIRSREGLYADFENTDRVVFLPMVPPASVFFPRPERRHDVTISGSGEGHRVAVLDRLVAEGFSVHRSGGMMPTDKLLAIDEYAEDLATSRIVVNTQTLDSRVQIKGRVAQCLASGTFLLEQDNPESRAYLEGIDVALWRDADELATLLRRYLADPEAREAMAQRAHLQWKARHSAHGFVRTLFDTIAAPQSPAPIARTPDSTPVVAPLVLKTSPRTAMRIYIHTGNHNNHNGIGDTVLFLKNALQDCGYTACISHQIVPGHVNILMENFVDPKHLAAMFGALGAGTRYILIGTEPIVNDTFNGGIEDNHFHYSNTPYWKVRFDAFRVAVEMASAVWVLAESMLPAYSELFPRVPVRFLPHGYVDDFATVRQRPEKERDIDFYFSGSLTDHRQGILKALGRTHEVCYNDIDTPEYLRQDHLSRAKVCLSLRLSPHNEIPSVSRMHFHLQNRSFLLHESYALPCPLDPFVMQAPADDVVGWALAALDLDNRREIADAAHARFKAALPMTHLLPPLLAEALGTNRSAPLREPELLIA